MKRSNILIAVATVFVLASTGKAEGIEVDFDGNGGRSISANDLRAVSFDDFVTPSAKVVSRCGSRKGRELCEDPETGSCYEYPPGYVQMPRNNSDRLADGTDSSSNSQNFPEKGHKEIPLKEILSGLTPAQKLFFFENLEFNEKGEVVSIYTRDIKENLGERVLQEVKKALGLKSGTERDGRDDKWCVSKGTCGYNPGYYCTEKC